MSYYVSFEDNKWGVIDSTGNSVITPSYQELIVIPNSKKDVFLLTYNVDYATGEYQTKVLNSKNEQIFQEYEKVEAISNYDKDNNIWYDPNTIKVMKDGKYGLIDLDGNEVLPIEYDEISAMAGIENAIEVKKDDKYGVVDSSGKEIITPEYSKIENIGQDNKSGYIVQDESGKYGIVDYSNNSILEKKYDEIEKVYGANLYVVSEEENKKIINKDGEEIETSSEFDSIKSISEIDTQSSGIIFKKDEKYGMMGLDGQTKIEPTYDDLTETKEGVLIAKKDDKYGIIDSEGTETLPIENASITYNKEADIYILEDESLNAKILDGNLDEKLEGLFLDIDTEKDYIKMRIGNEYKYYNFQFEEKPASSFLTSNNLFLSKENGKYGFVDKDGKVVVDYQYDDATEQNIDGFAAIKKDGKWGSIDSKGAITIEPTYDLDDYLQIDFIGEWHKGIDINLNYYSKD